MCKSEFLLDRFQYTLQALIDFSSAYSREAASLGLCQSKPRAQLTHLRRATTTTRDDALRERERETPHLHAPVCPPVSRKQMISISLSHWNSVSFLAFPLSLSLFSWRGVSSFRLYSFGVDGPTRDEETVESMPPEVLFAETTGGDGGSRYERGRGVCRVSRIVSDSGEKGDPHARATRAFEFSRQKKTPRASPSRFFLLPICELLERVYL